MKHQKTRLAVILSALILSISVPVIAGPGYHGQGHYGYDRGGPPLTEEQRQQYRQYHEERVQARLDVTAKQLRITSAQQGAWDAYSQAVKQTRRFDWTPPPQDADAATIVKFRADRAADHAKALAQLSDATAKLQATLSSEQRSTFNEVIRYRGGGYGRWGHRGYGPDGGAMGGPRCPVY